MNEISRRSFVPLLGTALVGASCLSLDKKTFDVPNDLILPKRLKHGDTIGVCAPAGCIKDASEIDDFTLVLKGLGFKVKIGNNVPNQYGYFSADDESRAKEFMDFVIDPNVHGIFTIRGGWGCARILDYLDFEAIKDNPKVIMGFSDFTTLLNAISSKTGLVTFHGPGGNSSWNEYTVGYIKNLIYKGEVVKYNNVPGIDSEIVTYSSGKATGKLYGGNLSVLCNLIGSNYLPDWKDKILVLEDVKEEPYRIDRMLTQLVLSGIIGDVNGIVLGNFRKCFAEEPDRSFTLEEVFHHHFATLDIPVYYGAQIGHTKNKFTVPIGMDVEIDADQGTIALLHPAVS
jgi:muramoyltetrapeptide carboxypeptidase